MEHSNSSLSKEFAGTNSAPGQTALHTSNRQLSRLRKTLGLGQIIGQSPAFAASVRQIPTIARYDVCALILGETGTGKEVFARAIHYHSRRSDKPFVPVNCGAVPADLIENEFFGHEPGAFTGANACHRGLLKEAHGGTLFLDEVDSLPQQAQVKLLRFIQDGQFRPLGCERSLTSDVRVIAASNVDLLDAIRSGRFRADLYYRLNVISFKLPPLRDREDDVVLLAHYFLSECCNRFGENKRFSPSALQKLLYYKWPGNVRELENVVQRAFILAQHTLIEPDDICVGPAEAIPAELNFQAQKAKVVEEFEQAYVRRVLRVHGGNITRAAQSAGKDRRAFWELMRKHRIGAKPSATPKTLDAGQNCNNAGQIHPGEEPSQKLPEFQLMLHQPG